jgi:Peptidase family M23/D-alanyl-D-alanine carboxypeptidase
MKKVFAFCFSLVLSTSLFPNIVTAQAPQAANPASQVGVPVDYSKLYDLAKDKPVIPYATIHESHPDWLCKTSISSTTLLCGPAKASFDAMNAAFKAAKGHDLSMSGGYRKRADQIAGGGTVERPGGSNPNMAPYDANKRPPEHGWGTAVDLSPGSAESVAWVKANGKKFGWFRPTWATDSIEYWHFQYYSSHHKGGTNLDADEKKGGIGPDGQAGGGGGGSSTASSCVITKVGNPTVPSPTVVCAGATDPSINCTGATCALKYIVNPYDNPGPNQDFGARPGGFHNGIDLAGAVGTPIHAPVAGIAINVHGGCANVRSTCGGRAGNYVFMRGDDGKTYKFMHMSTSPKVGVNAKITRGQVLGPRGTSGDSSGPHLHFQIEKGGSAVNPVTELATWPGTQ